jgi:hypothetical protein
MAQHTENTEISSQGAYDAAYDAAGISALSGATQDLRDHVASRGERVQASREGRDPGKVAPTSGATAASAVGALACFHGVDGRHAVARLLTRRIKAPDCASVQWADWRKLCGELVKLRQRADSATTRKQAQIRAAIDVADSRVEGLSRLRRELAAVSPGGSVWCRATSRAVKRSLRSQAKRISAAIERGDFTYRV